MPERGPSDKHALSAFYFPVVMSDAYFSAALLVSAPFVPVVSSFIWQSLV